ncbi:MAG: GAF domain-containing protein [Leptospiraceae bacterium]|nr:GAF domain-containing protein [Leptospiraceae bacterium]
MGLLEKADITKERIASSDKGEAEVETQENKKKNSLLKKAANLAQAGLKSISDKGLLKKAEKIHISEGSSDSASILEKKEVQPSEEKVDFENYDLGLTEYEHLEDKNKNIGNERFSVDEAPESQEENKDLFTDDNFLDDLNPEMGLQDIDQDLSPIEEIDDTENLQNPEKEIFGEDEQAQNLSLEVDSNHENNIIEESPAKEQEQELQSAVGEVKKSEDDLENIVPDELFRDWEKDAAYDAAKTPFRPKSEDPVEERRDYLFDDDSDFTTVPSEIHIASKKKIENYLALFELTKEISRSDSYDDFFEGLTYSLTGQIGCNCIAVFSSKHSEFDILHLVESHGLEVNPDWNIHKGDELYSIFASETSVRYAADLLTKIPSKEAELLRESNAEIIAPIRSGERFFGLILAGKNIGGEEYTADDLEFLKISGEISGSFFEKIQEAEKKNQLISHLNEVIKSNEIIISLSRKLSEVRDFDSALDEIIDTFSKELGVMRYTFFIYDKEEGNCYRAFSSNILSLESIQRLNFQRDSEIVGVVSNIPGVYNIAEFRQIRELRQQLTNDDLGFLREFIVIPFINLNWLVGMIVVHETSFPWTNTNREIAVGISEVAAPVLANVMMLKEKETVFRDPFNPIEKRIDQEIADCEKLSISFCLTIFKIQNAPRIINLLGQEFFVSFTDYLRNKIHENLSEADFFVKVGRGKFAVLFHGKDSEEAGIVIKKIKLKLDEYEKSPKDFKLSISTHCLTYPKDTKEKSGFLEILDES